MKKTLIVTIMLILTTVATVFAFGGKSGDKNATGEITQLKVANQFNPFATVTGITRDGKLWLAYTAYYNDGLEVDYDPIKVGDGKFTKTITYAIRPEGLDKLTVCLWRYKVSADRCAKDNGGTACEYCRKNGFHMEGRMDCKTGG